MIPEIPQSDVEVIPHGSQNMQQKLPTNPGTELIKLTAANRRLTKKNEALLKELEDLKLELAQQKSQNLLARRGHSDQVLEVLNTDLTCTICSDVIIEAVAIECGHIFCKYCISTWLIQHTSCPTCRGVTSKDPIKISKLTSAIDNFHMLLTQEVQSERLQLLEDRKADENEAREAATSEIEWFRNLSRAHERLTEAVRHDRPLSPDIHAVLEGDSSLEDQQPYLESQAPAESRDSFLSAETLALLPSLFPYGSLHPAFIQNSSRPTTLPLSPSSINNEDEASVVPPTSPLPSRHRPGSEASIFDDEVVAILAGLQPGPSSVSRQFHSRYPSLRRRPY